MVFVFANEFVCGRLNANATVPRLLAPSSSCNVAVTTPLAALLAALEPVTDEELFAADRWPELGGEALVETILWDSSRHYDAHREYLERLSR